MAWNLKLDEIAKHLETRGGLPKIAIETGTCLGNGTLALADRFEKVISIELSSTLHQETCARFSSPDFKHVELVRGDSASELPRILASLPKAEPIFFFLDAHWSGDRSVDWEKAKWKGYGFDTALGPRQCPLIEELNAIVEHCQAPCFILIDDLKNLPASGPGLKGHEFPGEDWSDLSRAKLLDCVSPRLRATREFQNPLQWFLELEALS